jgi:alkylated DNA repair dioxygenase AlkB
MAKIISQNSLFDSPDNNDEVVHITLPDASLSLYPHAFSATQADALFAQLQAEIPWRQDVLRIAGRQVAIPRLQCLLGEEALPYSYSGLSLSPVVFPSVLDEMRARLNKLCGRQFNAALANLYRDGCDSVHWHSDDEASLGENPVIASVSLGETRRFELRHRTDKSLAVQKIALTHGSVLVMEGGTQRYWEHRLPKDSHTVSPRINLTFRHLIQ